MGIWRSSALLLKANSWPIGKKLFLGNILLVITPLCLMFAAILHHTFIRLHASIEDGMEAAAYKVIFSPSRYPMSTFSDISSPNVLTPEALSWGFSQVRQRCLPQTANQGVRIPPRGAYLL